ncbi:MAG: hypothetical protein GX780_07250 [Campylobacteraceae bacterium]|nr:hypothetical protein [Campylobacteraceae bacterium]
MEINNINICNVCARPSDQDPSAVFIHAHKGGELVHICTACIPHVIHGSGDVVKPNATIQAENPR